MTVDGCGEVEEGIIDVDSLARLSLQLLDLLKADKGAFDRPTRYSDSAASQDVEFLDEYTVLSGALILQVVIFVGDLSVGNNPGLPKVCYIA